MSYLGQAPYSGNFSKFDTIVFDSVTSVFALKVSTVDYFPGSALAILISIGGVIQEPFIDFVVNGSAITFTSPPATGASFFGISLGRSVDVGTVADGSITDAKLAAAVGISKGGTGGTTAAAARTALGVAASGANTDITSVGAITGVTATIGDNTTKVATTAFVAAASPQIQSISASVAASALTILASTISLDFRSATLTSGTVTRVSDTPANLVVPSTATLGTVSATQSRLVVLALNNAGTIELAVVNIAGGNDLSETGLISTTAISAGATSASVVYSNTARTSVAYRVMGYIESTQSTAGTWATAPSTIQGVGGQALVVMGGFGYGQRPQNVTGSRSYSTTYYNTTGKSFDVYVTSSTSNGANYNATVSNGVDTMTITSPYTSANANHISFRVPAGYSYIVTTNGTLTLSSWYELR
jgi:hypothetical protein